MTKVEIESSELQQYVEIKWKVVWLESDIARLTTEVENKSKAVDEERVRRKKSEEKQKEMLTTIEDKDTEMNNLKEEYVDFELIKWNSDKWIEFEETKTAEINSKLDTIKTELWEELMWSHGKFLDNMSDELKLEYLENLKPADKEDFTNTPWGDDKTLKVKPWNDRLNILSDKKSDTWLSPREKIEYMTLSSQDESNL